MVYKREETLATLSGDDCRPPSIRGARPTMLLAINKPPPPPPPGWKAGGRIGRGRGRGRRTTTSIDDGIDRRKGKGGGGRRRRRTMRIHSRRTHYCRRVVGDFPPRSCGHALSRKHTTQASLHRRSKILLWGKVDICCVARPATRPPIQPSHVEAMDPTSNSIQNLRIPLFVIKAPFPPAATSFRLRLPTCQQTLLSALYGCIIIVEYVL